MDYESLFRTVSNENKTIENNIQNLTDVYSTDDQKVNYENDQIEWFIKTNNILYYIYYFLVLLFAIIIIMKNKRYLISIKILMIVSLLIMPFLIGPIEIGIYNIVRYIWSFIMVRAYPGNAFE